MFDASTARWRFRIVDRKESDDARDGGAREAGRMCITIEARGVCICRTWICREVPIGGVVECPKCKQRWVERNGRLSHDELAEFLARQGEPR
jgi:hypothetical protein